MSDGNTMTAVVSTPKGTFRRRFADKEEARRWVRAVIRGEPLGDESEVLRGVWQKQGQ